MITVFTLLVYASTGAFSDTDSVALTSVSNIETIQKCQQAGKAAESMADMTKKTIKFICVPTLK